REPCQSNAGPPDGGGVSGQGRHTLTRIFHEKTTKQNEKGIISGNYNQNVSYFENAKCKSTFAG
ncbi:hypothetical protein, partial [Desulfoluna spongiiphila]|uniref:hypothetical protein n=1 Tax=Desulfoluna spongiiphila TaxID=419481 RepID=UPI001C315449